MSRALLARQHGTHDTSGLTRCEQQPCTGGGGTAMHVCCAGTWRYCTSSSTTVPLDASKLLAQATHQVHVAAGGESRRAVGDVVVRWQACRAAAGPGGVREAAAVHACRGCFCNKQPWRHTAGVVDMVALSKQVDEPPAAQDAVRVIASKQACRAHHVKGGRAPTEPPLVVWWRWRRWWRRGRAAVGHLGDLAHGCGTGSAAQ